MFCGVCNVREFKKMKDNPMVRKEGSVMEADMKF